MITINREFKVTFEHFSNVSYNKCEIKIASDVKTRLDESREFINTLLEQNINVYGITSGFGELRNKTVSSNDSSKLSENIVKSHDTSIGKPLNVNIVRGAMFLRLVSLCRGHSGVQYDTVKLLADMLNYDIIPVVSEYGSLGCSGDLALLARVSMALIGEDIELYNGSTSNEAFKKYNLNSVKLLSKEGLALTNGTPFSVSQALIGFLDLEKYFDRAIHLIALYLHGFDTVKDAFTECMNSVRKQDGQMHIAKTILSLLEGYEQKTNNVQNDYSIRCLPQIIGPLYEEMQESKKVLLNEINCVNDNPLIYKNDEISNDVDEKRIYKIKDNKWAIISGGNFNGEYTTRICDNLRSALVKTVYTMEKQMTYALNPKRHGLDNLPVFLIHDKENAGLLSGFMIVQYTANSLAQKIAYLGNPHSTFNITSCNESEDILAYSMTSALSLCEQVNLFNDFLITYTSLVIQVISIANPKLGKIVGKIYETYQKELNYPFKEDKSFKKDFDKIRKINDDIDKIVIESKNEKVTKSMMTFDCIKGTRDFLPDDMMLRNWIFDIWHTIAKQFSFEEYDFPILEPFDLYARKSGEDIEKEMYVFNDNGGNKLALIPEATPSLARLVLKNGKKSNFPLRWYTIANCWRYETNTKTRKRQFYQWNMDIIGLNSIISQAEIILSTICFLKKVGIKEGEVEIRINSRKILQSFLDSIQVSDITQVCLVIDKILKVDESVILEMLLELGISKEKSEQIIEFSKCKDINTILEKYSVTSEAVKEIIYLFDILKDHKEWLKFDTSIIRGLSYYSGIVFEAYATKIDIPRAILGGGSYDSLFSMFEENKKIASIGYGLGDVVILEILKEMKRLPVLNKSVDYYIIPFDNEHVLPAFKIADMIRNKNKTCIIHDNLKMKKKNIYGLAEKLGALNTVFIAPTEWKEGKICVKNMTLGKHGKETQETFLIDDFMNSL